MRILLRVDSSAAMGTGHLMRCLTLANELREQGHDITFVCREHVGHLIHKIEQALYPVCRLPAPKQSTLTLLGTYSSWLGVTVEQDALEIIEMFAPGCYDWCIVDHYGLDYQWERMMRSIANRIFVIDDLANRKHDCELLLDQNYFGDLTSHRYNDWVPDFCQCLCGPKYALLQPEYAVLHATISKRNVSINRVLVFFGGSDLSNETGKVLQAFADSQLQHLFIDVVIGKNHPNFQYINDYAEDKSNVTLHKDLPSLAPLMMQADLAIGAGGATTWERMALGLPAIVICIAENQQQGAHILAEEGFQMLLTQGKQTSTEEWRDAIIHVLQNSSIVENFSQKTKILVDGLGVKRVAQFVCGESIEY